MSTIKVGDNESVESALRRFKRKCSRDGIIGDLRKKEFYESPSVKRRKKAEAARKRNKNLDAGAYQAREQGLNEVKVKSTLHGRVKSEIKGEKQDEFYLKVKRLLEEEGEVSDALGRLTDRVYYDTLSYEEKQRYTMQLSNKYLKALEKYRKEKEIGI